MSPDFIITTLIIVATPGVGALYTISTAFGAGRRDAIIAAFGCTLGIVPHMAAAILGLSAVVAAEPRLFDLIKYAGTAYLVWMAIGLWRAGAPVVSASARPLPAGAIIRKAVLINLLNPKLSIFFLAFLPQFVRLDTPDPLITMTGLSLVFMAQTFVVFALYGLAASQARSLFLESRRAMKIVNRLLAAGFLAMAARLAIAQR